VGRKKDGEVFDNLLLRNCSPLVHSRSPGFLPVRETPRPSYEGTTKLYSLLKMNAPLTYARHCTRQNTRVVSLIGYIYLAGFHLTVGKGLIKDIDATLVLIAAGVRMLFFKGS